MKKLLTTLAILISTLGVKAQTCTPELTVTDSISPLCVGTRASFTATGTDGGDEPIYKWFIGQTLVRIDTITGGEESTTLRTDTLTGIDTIRVVYLTDTVGGCDNRATDTAYVVHRSQAASAPVATITVSTNDTVCSSTPVTFTATVLRLGANTTYQWKNRGKNLPFATGSTYVYNSPKTADSITCVIISDTVCTTRSKDTSNVIRMVINTRTAASVVITDSANMITSCDSVHHKFTATPTNCGISPTYIWKNGAVTVGTNSATYSVDTLSKATTAISVKVVPTTSCPIIDTARYTLQMNIIKRKIPTATIVTLQNDTVDEGTSVLFTVTAVNGGAGPTYQWKVDDGGGYDNVGINSNRYTLPASSPADSYAVKCVVTSALRCPRTATATSNILTEVVE